MTALQQAAEAIDTQRIAIRMSTRTLATRSGWNRSALQRAHQGQATTYAAMADMATAVGLRVVYEPDVTVLPAWPWCARG